MVPVADWFARVPVYCVGVGDFAQDFAEDLLCLLLEGLAEIRDHDRS